MVSVLNLLSLFSTALQVSYAAQASILNSGNLIAVGEIAEGIVLAPALEIDMENGTVNDLSQKNWTYKANGQLTKRRDTLACLNVAISLGNMFSLNAAAAASWYVALNQNVPKEIKYRAEKHACGLVGHKSCKKGHKCIKYWYYATGKNCDTTAKEETIRGGLESAWNTYIHTAPNSVWCLKLTHGGTFAGHLLIGPNGDWGDVSCSANNDGTCVSGGVNTHWD